MLYLYLISQSANDDYDTYDAAVVCAPDVDTARNMNPSNGEQMTDEQWEENRQYGGGNWCSSRDEVKVEYLGEAAGSDVGVVLASFNAG